MRLYWSPVSPYVRKVVVTAREVGLEGRLELVPVAPSITDPDPSLPGFNPLAKIPTLVLDDGSSLFDSRVICEYLDGEHGGRRLVPEAGPERFRVLRLQALADGALDAGLLLRYETVLRAEGHRSAEWTSIQTRKVLRALDALEADVHAWPAAIDLGQIAVICALGWLEFRDPVGDVRPGRPNLFAWYERAKEHPSVRGTEPRL